MAEAIGLVASIFATVQITDRVISLCKRYIEGIQDAPNDLRIILIETSSVKAILENVQFLIECDNGQSEIFNNLNGPSGPIEGFHEAMKSLEALFRTDAAEPQRLSRSRKLKNHALVTLATLAWPLKESKARKLLQDVATYKSTIVLALTAETAHLTRDTARKTTQIQEALSDSQRHEVFKWLEDIDPSSLHHRAQDNYEPGTCDWAIRLPEWPQFLSGKGNCLWIHGIPGAGKTILASQLIDKIEEHCDASDSGRSMSVWYYCYFGHYQDESISLLKWILSRLCREANEVSDHLWKLFRHGGTPSLKHLLIAIERELEWFDEVYITVDAIDESKPREDLLKVIRQLATEKRFNKVRLLLTSREYFDIEKVLTDFSTPVSMRNPFLDADIRLYTKSRLRKEKRIQSWPIALQQETIEALSIGAKGMFRWVVCQIDVLRRVRISAVREALTRLPRNLNEAYDKIFEQILEEDLPFVNSALKWLWFEVNHRLDGRELLEMQMLTQAVDADRRRQKSDGVDLFHDTESLRELCGCLITVTPITLPNGHQILNVSFAHYTVLEYLASKDRRNPDPFFSLGKDRMILERAERIFQRALCFNYDDFEEYKAVDASRKSQWQQAVTHSFGSYCAYTSIDIIIDFDSILSNQSDLFELAFDVLDFTKNHFDPLFDFWTFGAASEDEILNFSFRSYNKYFKIKWEATPDAEIGILVTLLLLGCVGIARKLLARMDLQTSFQTILGFSFAYEYYRGEWPMLFPAVGIDVFKLLIEVGAGAFDPQGALIPFGPFHEHLDNCNDWCVLEKLLSLGASPNVSRCYVTPLQIAIASFDLDGVITLLNAGADPNAAGSIAALPWPEETAHFDFNILHGRPALQICRQMCGNEMVEHFAKWRFMKTAGPKAQTIKSRMEAALLEHGATE